MKTMIRLALRAALALAAGGVVARTAEPAAEQATGRVLVLTNERTIEGNIERDGDQYRVRRTVGEVWVPRENVLRLCDSNLEAYHFLCSRANLQDPDEHLRLSKWCQLHGLKKEALDEATAAVQMRPADAASRRLLQNLQRSLASKQPVPSAHPREEGDAAQAPPLVDTESLSVFVTRVQPILMNACANCHATGRGGNFKLTRTFDAGLGNRKASLQNLAAVLAQVNPEKPAGSTVLTSAVSLHSPNGDMPQPPLKGRESAAFRTLEDWVRTTVDMNPQLHGRPAGAPLPPATAVPSPSPAPGTPKVDAAPGHKVTEPPKAETKSASPSAFAATKQSTANVYTEPVDPFDPVIFNRQMHPQPKGGTDK